MEFTLTSFNSFNKNIHFTYFKEVFFEGHELNQATTSYKFDFENVTILEFENNYWIRSFLEMFHTHKKNINRISVN